MLKEDQPLIKEMQCRRRRRHFPFMGFESVFGTYLVKRKLVNNFERLEIAKLFRTENVFKEVFSSVVCGIISKRIGGEKAQLALKRIFFPRQVFYFSPLSFL